MVQVQVLIYVIHNDIMMLLSFSSVLETVLPHEY